MEYVKYDLYGDGDEFYVCWDFGELYRKLLDFQSLHSESDYYFD